MKKLLKFIYNIEDKSIYRIRTICGIKIITKPIELRLNIIEEKINFINTNIEERINFINNYITQNNDMYYNMLMKLRVYEIYSKHSNLS